MHVVWERGRSTDSKIRDTSLAIDAAWLESLFQAMRAGTDGVPQPPSGESSTAGSWTVAQPTITTAFAFAAYGGSLWCFAVSLRF